MDKELIKRVLAQVEPEVDRKAKMVLETLQKLPPNTAIPMDKIVQEFGNTMQGSIGKVEAWFDTVMKRTSQRFTSQMRVWTIVFAVLFAFGAHLDSFKILEQIWTIPGLRASLIASGDAISREASEILSAQGGTTQRTGPSVSPQILGDAMKELIEKEKAATAGLKVPEGAFKNLDEALHGLRKSLTAGRVDQSREEMLVAKYRELVLSKWLDKEKGRANAIKEVLAKAGFRLQIPTSCKEFRNFEEVSILGILVTAGLLSLGAPFWFNALKTLSNLRPLVASSATKAATGYTQS